MLGPFIISTSSGAKLLEAAGKRRSVAKTCRVVSVVISQVWFDALALQTGDARQYRARFFQYKNIWLAQ
ncbi:hypothetical protein XH87_00340 [Bradyrhizobium sp. CCBAU 53415]|nr:hypothetical protein [Bradyrhizobium sp. CCBAU 53415]